MEGKVRYNLPILNTYRIKVKGWISIDAESEDEALSQVEDKLEDFCIDYMDIEREEYDEN